ncbi:MAG: hypothetical protein KBT19_08060 [Lachnospiraceae bacterium]|nr:hypothetical protein [Candidatus Colinaster equi]
MSRLKLFHYKVIDGWGNMGIDSILEISPTEIKILWTFENETTKETVLTGKEDEFIEGLLECNILSWNDIYYENCTEDCGSWFLDMAFDDKYIHCTGIGGYPKEFISFLKHVGLGDSLTKQMEDYYRLDIKHTKQIKGSQAWDYLYRGTYCDVSIEELAMFERDRIEKSKLGR